MIDSTDIIKFEKAGFDGAKYIRMQTQAIEDRLAQFSGRMYLEIGGKFLYDPHAARVLPGFDAESKKEIFAAFAEVAEVMFCINVQDIIQNRQLSNKDIHFKEAIEQMIIAIQEKTGMKPHIVMNNMDPYSSSEEVLVFQKELQKKQYKVRERYVIEGYPDDKEYILSEDGFGQDDHIPLTKELILVTGAGSNSGKFSTCLGQIYQDELIGINSGYAKYETFPVWNLPLDHPINLAYESATADIGDYNMIDTYHQDAYGLEAVNYNRDIQAFTLLTTLAEEFLSGNNAIKKYKSPTDMGINTISGAIIDEEIVAIAASKEITRRKERYQQIAKRSKGGETAVQKCIDLEKQAKEYCQKKGYKL